MEANKFMGAGWQYLRMYPLAASVLATFNLVVLLPQS
jgi:hypothetical protein